MPTTATRRETCRRCERTLQIAAETQVQAFSTADALERLAREMRELGDEMAERNGEEERRGRD